MISIFFDLVCFFEALNKSFVTRQSFGGIMSNVGFVENFSKLGKFMRSYPYLPIPNMRGLTINSRNLIKSSLCRNYIFRTLSNVRFQSRRNLYFPGKLIRQIHLKLNYIVNFLNSWSLSHQTREVLRDLAWHTQDLAVCSRNRVIFPFLIRAHRRKTIFRNRHHFCSLPNHDFH